PTNFKLYGSSNEKISTRKEKDSIQKEEIEKEIKFEKKKNLSLQISLVAILTAMGIGGSYALVFIPNVEILTLTIFITSFLFGPAVGCPMAFISAIIFHGFNPWGVAPLPTLLILVVLYVFIGLVGGLLGKFQKRSGNQEIKQDFWIIYKYIIIGASITFMFDVVSAFSSIFFYPLDQITPGLLLLIYLAQIPFSIIHISCNAVLFGFAAPQIINRIQKFITTR
ncbi:MAG: hypothetical protein ACXQS8_09585, partial [Candidatus Helarchaeales archaeon]